MGSPPSLRQGSARNGDLPMAVLVILAVVAALASVSDQKIVQTPENGKVEATEQGITMKCLYNVTEASTEEPVKVEWFVDGSDDPIKEGGSSVLTMSEIYEDKYICKA